MHFQTTKWGFRWLTWLSIASIVVPLFILTCCPHIDKFLRFIISHYTKKYAKNFGERSLKRGVENWIFYLNWKLSLDIIFFYLCRWWYGVQTVYSTHHKTTIVYDTAAVPENRLRQNVAVVVHLGNDISITHFSQ